MNSQTFSPNLKNHHRLSCHLLLFAWTRETVLVTVTMVTISCLCLSACHVAWSRDSEWFSLGFPFSFCCPHRDLCSSCSLSVSQPVQYECKIAKSWCDKWWCVSLSTCWKIRWRSCKIDKQAPSSGKFSSSKWKWIVLLSSSLFSTLDPQSAVRLQKQKPQPWNVVTIVQMIEMALLEILYEATIHYFLLLLLFSLLFVGFLFLSLFGFS